MISAMQSDANDELYHHGIKGMKWGIRRYQNKDGSLTNAGKKRYDVNIEDANNKLRLAKKEQKEATSKYYRTYSKSSVEALNKANGKVNYAKQQLKNEKIKNKLNSEKSKSKRRLKLEEQYKNNGMSEEEAAIAAYKRTKTEKAIAAVSVMTITAAASYLAYKHYDKSVDKIIKPGTKIQNISTNSNKGVEDAFYFSQTKMDKAKYKGIYGKQLSLSGNKVYNTEIGVNKAVKVASEKSATNALKELVSGDKEYAEQLSKHLESSRNRYPTPAQNNLVSKAASKLASGKVDADVYNALNLTLVDHQLPTSSNVSKGLYDKLKSKGYDAIIDVNDRKYSGYKSSKPIIGFNMGDKATVNKISEIGEKEMQKNFNIGMADITIKANAPFVAAGAAYIAAIKSANNAVNNAVTKNSNDKIVKSYKKKHPQSELSKKEILDNYYNY